MMRSLTAAPDAVKLHEESADQEWPGAKGASYTTSGGDQMHAVATAAPELLRSSKLVSTTLVREYLYRSLCTSDPPKPVHATPTSEPTGSISAVDVLDCDELGDPLEEAPVMIVEYR
jgi:hypothetical protein